MKLITKEIMTKLKKARKVSMKNKPYLKLFNPCGAATWLITEIDEDENLMFGLCDLGMGYPELGYVSLEELKVLELPFGLKIERDAWFEADKTIGEYADMAYAKKRIVA